MTLLVFSPFVSDKSLRLINEISTVKTMQEYLDFENIATLGMIGD